MKLWVRYVNVFPERRVSMICVGKPRTKDSKDEAVNRILETIITGRADKEWNPRAQKR